jgi:hypothetical protein
MLAGPALSALVTATLLGTAVPATAVPAPPPLIQGRLVTGQAPGRCLTGGVVGTVLHTTACRAGRAAQSFYQTSEGHFTNNGNCVEPRQALVRVAICTYTASQDWWYTGTLRAGRYGRCLTEVAVDQTGQGTVRLRGCADEITQKWRTQNPG